MKQNVERRINGHFASTLLRGPVSAGVLDEQTPCFKIYLRPTEPERFPLPQTGQTAQSQKRPPAILPTSIEQSTERWTINVFPIFVGLRRLGPDATKGIGWNEVFINSRPKDRLSLTDVPADSGLRRLRDPRVFSG